MLSLGAIFAVFAVDFGSSEMHFVSYIAVKSKGCAFFKLEASKSTSEPFLASLGPLLGPFGEVFWCLLGFLGGS